MATLNLQHIDKIYDNNVQAVFDFNLDVKDGELIVLVGPSGCGKSTTLRMVAGLEDISNGKLLLDGKDITATPAKDRDMAMGRSIVRNPKVFLFDEPLSNLDAKLRGATRREILLLHKRLQATMMYVTHDQTEALTLADRIVCMSMGHVQQVGTPLELYDSPANVFVASFIGLPPMNFYDVRVDNDKLVGQGFQVSLTEEEKHSLRAYNNKEITLGVRPENIVEGADVPVTVTTNENLGMNTLVHSYVGGNKGVKISAKLKGWRDYKTGDTASFTFNRKHFFDKETTNAIRGGEGK